MIRRFCGANLSILITAATSKRKSIIWECWKSRIFEFLRNRRSFLHSSSLVSMRNCFSLNVLLSFYYKIQDSRISIHTESSRLETVPHTLNSGFSTQILEKRWIRKLDFLHVDGQQVEHHFSSTAFDNYCLGCVLFLHHSKLHMFSLLTVGPIKHHEFVSICQQLWIIISSNLYSLFMCLLWQLRNWPKANAL